MLINDPNCTFGAQNLMTVTLSMLTGTPKRVLISGFDSTDSNGMSVGKPSEYQFRLNSPIPQGATASNLTPTVRGTIDRAELTLSGPGLYRVSLQVFDGCGQAGLPINLNINALP
jgi:hypothetical protein